MIGNTNSNVIHYNNKCLNDLINGNFSGELVIPDGITSIRSNAFDGFNGITSLKISDTVESIGDYAFNRCTSITSVKIPKGVKSIGQCAFSGTSITGYGVVIPAGCSSLGERIFMDSWKLTDISDILSETDKIGAQMFNGCQQLQEVVTPKKKYKIMWFPLIEVVKI